MPQRADSSALTPLYQTLQIPKASIVIAMWKIGLSISSTRPDIVRKSLFPYLEMKVRK